jgi:hypothetical protein
MTTALDLITDAMEEAGILTKTESPSDEEVQTGLNRLNRLISSWSNTTNLVFERVTESFPLTTLDTTYTIGSGGDFNTVRPTKIIQAHIQDNNITYNLEVVTDRIYQSVTYKTIGGLPELLNYTNEYPLATINIYPAPSTTYTLFLTSEKPLTSYATINTTVDLPSGWEDALTYNLAVRLCPVYGQPVDPELKALARETKAMISLNSLRNNPLQSQPTPGRGANNNVYSGYYT